MKEVRLSTSTISNKQKAKPQEIIANPKAKKRKTFKIVFLLLLGLFILGFSAVYYLYSTQLKDFVKTFLSGNECEGEECSQSGGLWGSLVEEPELKKTGNLTNFLLIGIDTREEQPGLMNTDTIMVVTYDHSNETVFMTSIPRDTYVKIPAIKPYYSRINSVYAQGVRDGDSETGISYLTEVVEEITGLEIHYHAMVNYEAFLQVIDEVGGIEVCVETEFYGQYPKGDDWESVHFYTGCQQMDGKTALKYARTRYANAESGEASDYARAKRQQKVIIAAKDKILSAGTLLDPTSIVNFIQIIGDNIKLSDYNQEDIRAGISIIKIFDNSKVVNVVLEPSIAGGNVIHVIPGDAYLIGPTSGNWEQIHEFVKTYIANPKLLQESAEIYVYNGGATVGGAGELVDSLSENILLDLTVGGNTTKRDYTGITIYDFSGGTMSGTLEVLKSSIEGAEIITEIPDYVDNWSNEDIVIIIGTEVVEETEVTTDNESSE